MSIGWLFVVVGIGLLPIAIVDARVTWKFVQRAESVEGVVTDLYAGAAHPKVEFTTRDGRLVTVAGTGFTRHRSGDRVRMLYRSEAAEGAKLDEPGALWFSSAMTALLGVAMLVAGMISLR